MREMTRWGVVLMASVMAIGCGEDEGSPAEGGPTTAESSSALNAAGDVGWVGWTGAAIRTSYNSAGGVNTVTHLGTGQWRVTYPSLSAFAANSGSAVVSAANGGYNDCKIASFYRTGLTTQVVNVECRQNGALADAAFETLFFRGGNGSKGAYTWADQPTNASYTPLASYTWNAYAGSVSITRSAVGTYRVRFPNGSASSGNVQVSAYGSGNFSCQLAGYGPPSGLATDVDVRCFDDTGALSDQRFTIHQLLDPLPGVGASWARSTSLGGGAFSLPGAYMFGTVTSTVVGGFQRFTMSGPNGLHLTTHDGTTMARCTERSFTSTPTTSGYEVKCGSPGSANTLDYSTAILHLY